MTDDLPKLRTVGVMAAELGVSLSRVGYVVRSRGIEATARAGRLRLFNREAQARVRHELNLIDARRSDRGEGTP